MTTLYDEDLAYIQAAGFGNHAARAIAEVIPRLRAAGARRVLDIGCGAGVTTRALVEAGFAVTAIEPSAPLLAAARAAAPAAEFIAGSVYDVALPACDAILAIGEPLTYHEPDTDAEGRLERLFRNAHAVLPAGGLFIFDVITSGEASLDARGYTTGEDWAVLYTAREHEAHLTRWIETFRRTDDGMYRRGKETHHVRVFHAGLVRDWLARGFDVETAETYGEYQLLPRRTAFFATRRA